MSRAAFSITTTVKSVPLAGQHTIAFTVTNLLERQVRINSYVVVSKDDEELDDLEFIHVVEPSTTDLAPDGTTTVSVRVDVPEELPADWQRERPSLQLRLMVRNIDRPDDERGQSVPVTLHPSEDRPPPPPPQTRKLPWLLIAIIAGGAAVLAAIIVVIVVVASRDDGETPPDAAPPDAPVVLCGNSKIDPGESCDDGNPVTGDGCSATCQIEEQCLIAHNGGSPAVSTAIHVSPDGTLRMLGTTPLPGNDAPAPWPSRLQGATSCGRTVYYALSSGALVAASVALDGTLTVVGPAQSIDGIFALYCDEEDQLLFAARSSVDLTVELQVFDARDPRRLSLRSRQELTFFGDQRVGIELLRHPGKKELFLIGAVEGIFNRSLDYYHIFYGPTGTLTGTNGPRTIAKDFAQGVRFNRDASTMFVVGFSGSALAFGPLRPDGELPGTNNLSIVATGVVPSNGYDMVFRQDLDIYYYSGLEGGTARISVGELRNGTLSQLAVATGGSSNEHLHLAYDGRVLLVGDRPTGEIRSFRVSQNGVSLTLASILRLPSSTEFMAAALVSCPAVRTAPPPGSADPSATPAK